MTPDCPYDLGPAGTAWWSWAWTTPQSSRWVQGGALYTAARRAQLEDEAAMSVFAGEEDLLANLLLGADQSAVRDVTYALQRLAASATKSTGLSREMRELETQLGLGPKASAALGVKPDDAPKNDGLDDLTKRRKARRDRASGTAV